MKTFTVRDEALGGGVKNEFLHSSPTDHLSVRELIKSRISEEVKNYNANLLSDPAASFRGLIEPTNSEKTPSGVRLKNLRSVNWEEQYNRAIEAFENNQIFVLVNDTQIDKLDHVIELDDTTIITFLRLVPLVGG